MSANQSTGSKLYKKILVPIDGSSLSVAALDYANSLAAITFIHEKDFVEAERIFHCFQRYYLSNKDHFNGLPQLWNVETGIPESSAVHWEGDVAFLTLALNYYQQSTEANRNFLELHNGLTKWLLQKAKNSNLIVAESIVYEGC